MDIWEKLIRNDTEKQVLFPAMAGAVSGDVLKMAELRESTTSDILTELQRRDQAEAVASEPKPADKVENLIGPAEACARLNMTQRKLYALESKGRLPFARSRSRKDRQYDLAGLLKWASKPRVAPMPTDDDDKGKNVSKHPLTRPRRRAMCVVNGGFET